jgi:hypothetical protein
VIAIVLWSQRPAGVAPQMNEATAQAPMERASTSQLASTSGDEIDFLLGALRAASREPRAAGQKRC